MCYNEAMLELVTENHPILQKTMPKVEEVVGLRQLAHDMFLLMWSNGGVGLAAPQVGIAVRMFVMGPQSGPNYVCINPEIQESGAVAIAKEGCLSFPGLWLSISRPSWVQARYQTLDGTWVEQRFDGLLAQCYQHELDHLNGELFVNRSSRLGLKMARERQQKEIRKMKRVESQA